MRGLFKHRRGTDAGWATEELPGPGRPLTIADRACCCPARPTVTVMMPPGQGRPRPTDLLLCGHHYRASRARLRAAGAVVYDAAGTLIAPGDDAQPEDSGQRGDRHVGRRVPQQRVTPITPRSPHAQDLRRSVYSHAGDGRLDMKA